MRPEIKSSQLGMNHSTARNRLVKSIMFDMMKRLGEDKCFKCGDAIQDIDHMSIEHKVPWLHNDPELFWDLGNIAFSHLACNKPDRPWLTAQNNPSVIAKRRLLKDGFSVCSRCKKKKPLSEFTAHSQKRYSHSARFVTTNTEDRCAVNHGSVPQRKRGCLLSNVSGYRNSPDSPDFVLMVE